MANLKITLGQLIELRKVGVLSENAAFKLLSSEKWEGGKVEVKKD